MNLKKKCLLSELKSSAIFFFVRKEETLRRAAILTMKGIFLTYD